jgi:hypothetical protein
MALDALLSPQGYVGRIAGLHTRTPPECHGEGGDSRALMMHVSDRGLYPAYLLPPQTLWQLPTWRLPWRVAGQVFACSLRGEPNRIHPAACGAAPLCPQ